MVGYTHVMCLAGDINFWIRSLVKLPITCWKVIIPRTMFFLLTHETKYAIYIKGPTQLGS